MNIRYLSFEELENLETNLNDRDNDSEYSLTSQKIQVYEEMHRRLRQLVRNQKEDVNYLNSITDLLVFNLIHYGTFMKMNYQKDNNTAKHSLEKALKYDRTNPIAAYRLGFLAYRESAYSEALTYLQQALNSQQISKDNRYLLNDQQILNAHLYLTNSALYIASQTYENINLLPNQNQSELPNYEFSTLYPRLTDSDNYLKRNAFYKITQDSKTTCSREECEELITLEPQDTIVLYFNDRNIVLLFNDNTETMSQDLSDILRYILLKSNEANPATRFTLQNFFPSSKNEEIVKNATFRKRFSRLKLKMDSCQIPTVIHLANHPAETAYYFDGSLPFIIMYRVDEEMEYIF